VRGRLKLPSAALAVGGITAALDNGGDVVKGHVTGSTPPDAAAAAAAAAVYAICLI